MENVYVLVGTWGGIVEKVSVYKDLKQAEAAKEKIIKQWSKLTVNKSYYDVCIYVTPIKG